MILIQAIRNAMVNDLVVRNVADLAAEPSRGTRGRHCRSFNLEQRWPVLDAAKEERLWRGRVYRSVRRTGEDRARAVAAHVPDCPQGFAWRRSGTSSWSRGRTDRGKGPGRR